MLQNRAARVITGARLDVNSANVLEDLQWSTFDVRRHRLKSVLMYKILNVIEQSAPSLREKFIKIKDLNREHNLRSNDTDLALPKPKTNYLKCSFSLLGIVVQCCGIVFLLRQKRHPRFINLNAVCPLYPRLGCELR